MLQGDQIFDSMGFFVVFNRVVLRLTTVVITAAAAKAGKNTN